MEQSMKIMLKSDEIILIILQYLKEHGLVKSMLALESETKLRLSQYGKEISFFRQLIVEGQWEDAENFLNPLKIRQHFNYDRAVFELKKQQFLEDIECCHSDELDIVGLLSRAKDLQDKCTKTEFNNLCSYLTLPNLRDHPDFKNWSVEKGRMECFEKILELLKTVYPVESHENKIKNGRLFELLKQAIKFQCVIQGNTDTESITLLQDSFTEEQEKTTLEGLFGKYKLQIKEEKQIAKEGDNLSESASSIYFGPAKNFQMDPRNQTSRPLTAYSTNFAETFHPKKATKLDLSNKQAGQKPTKEKAYEPQIPNEPIVKEAVQEYTEQEFTTMVNNEPKLQAYNNEEEIKSHIDITKMAKRSMIVDKQPIRTCCFSPEGELLAIGTNSMTLKICSLKDIVYSLDDKYKSQLEGPLELPTVLEQRKYHNGSIYTVEWSHTGRLIASGSNDRTINLLISPFSDPSNTNKVHNLLR